MVFLDAYSMWTERRLTQEQAAELLGVSARTFRRFRGALRRGRDRGSAGQEGVAGVAPRGDPDEVMEMVGKYETDHDGWYVRHFYSFYRDGGGTRSYSWVKNKLQEHGKVRRGKGRGKHRKRREPAPLPGMLLHQDASTHEWVPGSWWDLVVTMDDATNEHHSMFLCAEEGTWSSFLGVAETIRAKGLFCSLYTDRASHYWTTPEAGGKVDKSNPAQFGRALVTEFGIEMIPAYSPEARGRSERGVRHAPGAAAAGAGIGRDHGHGLGEPPHPGGVPAEVQRGVRAPGAGGGFGVRADGGSGRPGHHSLRGARAQGGPGQLRELRGAAAATAGRPPQTALHEGEDQGEAAHGRPPVRVARTKAAARVCGGWPAAGKCDSGGGLMGAPGWCRSALRALRSLRAERHHPGMLSAKADTSICCQHAPRSNRIRFFNSMRNYSKEEADRPIHS